MEIVSCFRDLSEIEPLAEAGAAEFYCGVEGIPGAGPVVLSSLEELGRAVGRVHALGRKIALAVNCLELEFDERQCAELAARIMEIDQLGIDNFIVANPAIFLMLEDYRRSHRIDGPKAGFHLSSLQPCFNHLAVDYFRGFGVSRLILPNQLSAAEAGKMLALCAREGIETEIFDYRFFGCVYINGKCRLHTPVFHTLATGTDCRLFCQAGVVDASPVELKSVRVAPDKAREAVALTERVAKRVRGGGGDRISDAASFFDYFAAGAGYLKYGTRTDASELKVRKVRQMREMLRLVEGLIREGGAVSAREAFLSRMGSWNWAAIR